MANHTLYIEHEDENHEEFYAIHSHLEDYRLAYFLNLHLKISLAKSKTDIEIKTTDGNVYFEKFEYEDENENKITLFHNSSYYKKNTKNKKSFGLFEENQIIEQSKLYLLPEYKEVDYLLKINQASDEGFTEIIAEKLGLIKQISKYNLIEKNKIKSKKSLGIVRDRQSSSQKY